MLIAKQIDEKINPPLLNVDSKAKKFLSTSK